MDHRLCRLADDDLVGRAHDNACDACSDCIYVCDDPRRMLDKIRVDTNAVEDRAARRVDSKVDGLGVDRGKLLRKVVCVDSEITDLLIDEDLSLIAACHLIDLEPRLLLGAALGTVDDVRGA